jgi:hypothetical protein
VDCVKLSGGASLIFRAKALIADIAGSQQMAARFIERESHLIFFSRLSALNAGRDACAPRKRFAL